MKRKTVLLIIGLVLGLWGTTALKAMGLLSGWSWWEATAPLWSLAEMSGLVALCLGADRVLRWIDKVSA